MQGSSGTVKITVNGPNQSHQRRIHQSTNDETFTYDESFGSNQLTAWCGNILNEVKKVLPEGFHRYKKRGLSIFN